MPSRAEPYERAAAALIATSGCTIRRYRSGNSGGAYTRDDDWGVEVPRPRGPVSFAVFAHEVGHQLLHRGNSKPRWLEEIEAWEFAFECFERFELRGVERARRDAAKHLRRVFLRSGRGAKPETVQRMTERFPPWVWPDE